jgi:integrase
MPKLTKRVIDGMNANPAKDIFLWDEELKGFGLKVTPRGAKTYILQYRNTVGRSRRMKIGTHGPTTPDQARELAKQYLGCIATAQDPLEEKKELKRKPTFRDLATDYMALHANNKKRPKSIKEDHSMLTRTLLPAFARKKVDEVNTRDIQHLHKSLQTTPYRANRVLALLSKMFSLAVSWGWRSDNPVKGVERYHELKRDRWLDEAELAAVATALDQHLNQQMVNAIRLILLTGARKSEVLNATWDQFYLERGLWIKPSHATKQKQTEHLPLSQASLALLRQMKETASGSPYLFPGQKERQPVQDIKRFWKSILKQAGVKDCRIHDLRHTHASHLVSSGYSLPIVGRLLGHTQASTTQRYAHLANAPLREAADYFGDTFLSLVRKEEQ